jgi:hypothetical protein
MPNNHDALAYRIPRVLNWLAEGHWYWIPNFRGWQNTRACSFEWSIAPILALAKSDRYLFLLNSASYLLFPGLTFSFFTRMGVRSRTAWYWMWLLPTGFCFALQAGSMANDLYGAVFAMAALDFALRAQSTKNPEDVFFSILAAACMTNAKSSNLPLLLPWAIAIFPSIRLLAVRPFASLLVLILAALSSLLPTIALNVKYSGDWTGLKAEEVPVLASDSFSAGRHNAALLLLQNFTPPVFPFASSWNKMIEHRIPAGWKKKLDTIAEDGWRSYKLKELAGEEWAGLGFGISCLILLQFSLAIWHRFSFKRRQLAISDASSSIAQEAEGSSLPVRPSLPVRNQTFSYTAWSSLLGGNFGNQSCFWRRVLRLSPFISLAVFMAKSGLAPAARTITPYYALLLPALLVISDFPGMVSARIWRSMAGLSFFCAFIAVVFTPARPLWPARTILSALQTKFNSPLLERAQRTYEVYRNRQDNFAELRKLLPPASNVGLVTITDAETSLRRPFGRRRVYHVLHSTTSEDLVRWNVHLVIVNTTVADRVLGVPFQQWLSTNRGQVITNVNLKIMASEEPFRYAVVVLPDLIPEKH